MIEKKGNKINFYCKKKMEKGVGLKKRKRKNLDKYIDRKSEEEEQKIDKKYKNSSY